MREEAGELCETLESKEGAERTASEAADLLYHTIVLLNSQVSPLSPLLLVHACKHAQIDLDTWLL